MKHRIVTEDQNDEDVIEWKFEVDSGGYPVLFARRPSGHWLAVAWVGGDNSFSADRGSLIALGFKRFGQD